MDRLGKYELIEPLGKGSFGTVYRARDTESDTEVAVKVLNPALVAATGFIQGFQEEAQRMKRLEHPHLVPVYDLEEDEGSYFLVMKYMAGGSLKGVLEREGKLSFKRTVEVVKQLADALNFAYKQPEQLIHKDIKPGDILFDEDGGARLSDLGFTKKLAGVRGVSLSTSWGMIGTPAYMAPEIWEGREATPATDVYSLACVVYEMLTGEALFSGDDPAEVMTKHLTDGPQFENGWMEGLPRGIQHILEKALSMDPEERYPNANAFVRFLEVMLRASTPRKRRKPAPETEEQAEPPRESAPPRKRVRPAVRRRPPRPKEEPPPPPQIKISKGWCVLGVIVVILVCIAVVCGISKLLNPSTSQTTEPTEGTVLLPTSTYTPTPTPTEVPTQTPTSDPNISLSPTLTPTPTLEPGATQIAPVDGMVMVYVPEGEFIMGSEDGDSHEQPVHTVYLEAFWIDQTEVTNRMFAVFLNAVGNQNENGANWLDELDAYVLIEQVLGVWQPTRGFAVHPVVEVSWFGARAYCEWAGRRLPTEAEWEKAARGEDGLVYPWGDEFDSSLANVDDEIIDDSFTIICDPAGCDGYDRTAPVGSFPGGASPFGVLDMAGNAREWVWDWYDGQFYRVSPHDNPVNEIEGNHRVLRGGSWMVDDWFVRTAFRASWFPIVTLDDYGFRCALSE
jgi:serine/threonine-protein kinase